MIRAAVFSLLGLESTLCLAMLRRSAVYPITAATMAAIAMAYGWLSWVRYTSGARAYYAAVDSSRWVFMLAAAAVAIESVRLMARRLHASHFALATSILFAALSAVAAWCAGRNLEPGTAWFGREQEWAIACVLFVAANHWFHRRAGPLPPDADRHAAGTLAMFAGNAIAFLILGEGRGVYWAEVAGLLIQRLGPIVGLSVWLRR